MNPSERNFETVDQTEERLAQPRVEQSAPTVVEAKTEEKSPSFWQKIRKNLFKSTAAVAVVGASFGAGHAAGEMNVVEKPEVSQPELTELNDDFGISMSTPSIVEQNGNDNDNLANNGLTPMPPEQYSLTPPETTYTLPDITSPHGLVETGSIYDTPGSEVSIIAPGAIASPLDKASDNGRLTPPVASPLGEEVNNGYILENGPVEPPAK